MYAPETYKPSSDADKVADGAGGGGEDGIVAKEKKIRVGRGRLGEGFFAGWVRSKQEEAADFVESVLFSYWLICVF